MKHMIIDTQTGEVTVRDMTKKELAQYEKVNEVEAAPE